MIFSMNKKSFFILISILIVAPGLSLAWSLSQTFFVDFNYDASSRTQIETQLIKTTNQLYFYADKNWYNNLQEKNQFASVLYSLATEFENKIYPNLTKILGSEDKPGIDNDQRLVIVIEPLKESYGGYVRVSDNYPKSVAKESNEGQIIYLNANLILKRDLNFLTYELAHEFAHLITLKQKPNSDIWFYELISEFAGQVSTQDSSKITLKKAQDFLYSAEVNLKDWKNSDKDYAKVYLLALYLREQFQNDLFKEVLNYPSNDAIISFDEALKSKGLSFDEVYLNWLITNVLNNCENNSKYCYKDPNLKDFSVTPYSYYLPMQEKSLLSVTDSIMPFTGKWQKINGGKATVELKFDIPQQTPITKIPYIIENTSGKKTLGFFDFSLSNIGKLYVQKIGTENKSIYFIPYLGSKVTENKLYYYSFEVQSLSDSNETEQKIIEELLKKVEELKRQLAKLQFQIAASKTYQNNPNCSLFERDLYYGMESEEVKCLQQFLANLGDDIYPEKLVTGYYGPLTLAAVKRYQTLKGIITTGYFGPLTRAQANQEM